MGLPRFLQALQTLGSDAFNGKNHRLVKDNLDKDIIPSESRVIVKKNSIKISMRKAKGQYGAWRSNVCGGRADRLGQVPTAASVCSRAHRPCMGDLSLRARELFLLDWWFIS